LRAAGDRVRLWGKALTVAAVLAGMGVTGMMCARVAQRGRYAAAYSTFGAGPEGAKALYLLAEALGGQPTRLVEDVSDLPEGGLLVVLGGCGGGRAPTPLEVGHVQRWVDRGGVLLVAGARHLAHEATGLGVHLVGGCADPSWIDSLLSTPDLADDVEEELHEDAHADDEEDEAPILHFGEPLHFAHPVGVPLEGLGLVAMASPAVVAVGDGVKSEVLLIQPSLGESSATDAPVTEEGSVAAVAIARGKGTVIAVASAAPFQNRYLGWGEGGLLFARLYRHYADGQPVVFDEYHLGVGDRRSLGRYIRQVGGGPVVLQLLLVVLLLLWTRGVTFGTPRAAAAAAPAGAASYVDAVARLYHRSGDATGAVRALARRALGLIARHHHLRPASAHGLAKMLDARGRAEEARAVRCVGELEVATQSERALGEAVRALDGHIRSATAEEKAS
jgi:hypothetical protein